MSVSLFKIDVTIPLDSFDLRVKVESNSDALGIFGPSGSGKTTFLETLAGLRRKVSGQVCFDSVEWKSDSGRTDMPPESRRIGYVPQDHLLFPHWDVRKNLKAGAQRVSDGRDSLFEKVVSALELGDLLDRSVNELSGGEKQRVALGRALCSEPKLLLLDEPLASLDLKLRSKILPFLLRVKEGFRIPMVIVSHNPVELLALCDEVIAIDKGCVVDQGIPSEVFANPNVYGVAAGEGYENVLRSRIAGLSGKGSVLEIGEGADVQTISAPKANGSVGDSALFGIRSQDIMISNERIHGVSARNWLSAKVQDLSIVEEKRILSAVVGGDLSKRIVVELTQDAVSELSLEPGREVWLFFKSTAVTLYG